MALFGKDKEIGDVVEFDNDTSAYTKNGLKWPGSNDRIGVATYDYKSSYHSSYVSVKMVTIKINTGAQTYISAETALALSFALFDIVEKVKPELIQKDVGPKS